MQKIDAIHRTQLSQSWGRNKHIVGIEVSKFFLSEGMYHTNTKLATYLQQQ